MLSRTINIIKSLRSRTISVGQVVKWFCNKLDKSTIEVLLYLTNLYFTKYV